MIVSPFFPRASKHVFSLPKSTYVYTWILDSEIGPLLCDCAWTVDSEAKSHFWADKKNATLIRMKLGTYINRHQKEITGMNPFWEINRDEFMEKWYASHNRR